ncbi:hypothetical protein DFP72DRAFT_851518 [Ephemerocybe angulata]|uniref:Uncharacterized protein n=1 Tax=Ephemerocybe angulata TaxID=980116 RepID=A0A8H6HQY8_9AGAR|nr:hypothetical protein DFP72DRAFT_851518 [Tulosesus angulatus]
MNIQTHGFGEWDERKCLKGTPAVFHSISSLYKTSLVSEYTLPFERCPNSFPAMLVLSFRAFHIKEVRFQTQRIFALLLNLYGRVVDLRECNKLTVKCRGIPPTPGFRGTSVRNSSKYPIIRFQPFQQHIQTALACSKTLSNVYPMTSQAHVDDTHRRSTTMKPCTWPSYFFVHYAQSAIALSHVAVIVLHAQIRPLSMSCNTILHESVRNPDSLIPVANTPHTPARSILSSLAVSSGSEERVSAVILSVRAMRHVDSGGVDRIRRVILLSLFVV